MSARLLSVCLILAALAGATSARLGAKPPDLPVQAVEFKDSTPEPLPIPAETPRTAPAPKKAATPVKMVTKVYPVADLVIPVGGDKKAPVKTTEHRLIKLISTTVAPESWAAKGGEGTIDYFPLTMALAVNQPWDIQEKIAEVLASLRKMQDVEVAVEVRFLSVSEAVFKDLFINGELNKAADEPTDCGKDSCDKATGEKPGYIRGITPCKKSAPKGVAFLSDIQVFLLLEAIQADRHTNVMQAPKIAMPNGQPAEFVVEEQRAFVTGLDVSRKDDQLVFQPKTETFSTGLKMALQPVVSADKRSVRISVNATETTLDSEKVPLIPVSTPVTPKEGDPTEPFTQFIQNPKFTTLTVDKTFTLPDGGTALFNVGKRTREIDGGFRPPVLADLPYFSRLFADTGVHKETECVLMLVTPRIIVDSETEQPTQTIASAPKQPTATPAHGGSYEQEEPACSQKKTKDCCAAGAPCCELSVTCAACPSCNDSKVTELVKKYHKACADGHRAEATELAVQALALDPMCFGKERNSKGR
jgi:type II secretory pathway component GspD/PulD (secretin)